MTPHLDHRTLDTQLHAAIAQLAQAREALEIVISQGDGYPVGKFRLAQERDRLKAELAEARKENTRLAGEWNARYDTPVWRSLEQAYREVYPGRDVVSADVLRWADTFIAAHRGVRADLAAMTAKRDALFEEVTAKGRELARLTALVREGIALIDAAVDVPDIHGRRDGQPCQTCAWKRKAGAAIQQASNDGPAQSGGNGESRPVLPSLGTTPAVPTPEAGKPNCELCGQPMPPGEESFKYHGFSGPCPAPMLAAPPAAGGEQCETCGAKISSYLNGCPLCGAPNCCQACCKRDHAAAGTETTNLYVCAGCHRLSSIPCAYCEGRKAVGGERTQRGAVEVQALAAAMLEKLAANAHKPDWTTQKLTYLRDRLDQELAEFDEAVASGDPAAVRNEAADVANFLMMVSDRYSAFAPRTEEP